MFSKRSANLLKAGYALEHFMPLCHHKQGTLQLCTQHSCLAETTTGCLTHHRNGRGGLWEHRFGRLSRQHRAACAPALHSQASLHTPALLSARPCGGSGLTTHSTSVACQLSSIQYKVELLPPTQSAVAFCLGRAGHTECATRHRRAPQQAERPTHLLLQARLSAGGLQGRTLVGLYRGAALDNPSKAAD